MTPMCPRCADAPLATSSTHGVWVMYCAKCWGLWVDHASVRHVVGLAIDGATRTNGDPMACPVCRAALRAWSAKGIVIDRCDAHGVWFDRSELDQLVASAHGRGETRDGVGVGLAVGGVAVGTVATVAAMQSPSSTSERVDTGIEAVGAIADGLPLVDAAPEIAAGAGEAASAVLEGGAEAAGGVFEAVGAIFDIFS